MENKIEFSKDGTSFSFILDSSKSPEIYSKEVGFKTILVLLGKSKITNKEYGEFHKKILRAEKLPWNEREKVALPVGLGLLAELVLLSSLADLSNEPDEPVEIAYFKMCNCGQNHGRIYFKTGYTGGIHLKKIGMYYIDKLKEEKEISSEEFDKVKAEIESSSLPD